MVTLKDKHGQERKFELAHAQNILNTKPVPGWTLSDPNYELKNGNIARKSSRSTDKGAKESKKDKTA